jgi:hypothetical protein
LPANHNEKIVPAARCLGLAYLLTAEHPTQAELGRGTRPGNRLQFALAKRRCFASECAVKLMQRLLTDEEAANARAMINWTFWSPPTIVTAGCIVAIFFLWGADAVAWGIFAPLVMVTGAFWFSRARRYRRITEEIERRIVEVLEGAPEKAWLTRSAAYVRLSGINIQVPHDRYAELRDANSVKVALLPVTRIAVRIDIARGIGLA